ncbi:hypothetical protein LOK49_LG07G01754 [Camellia lanceoleosa]|uniref:Uncharacterized protein n=1 Tax=Camellia lanceoleosa TaxID=1840588 RepID=A0ACC0HB81_9ERIC|nr:hypothetical protein LOK49_LG07G01754 [Camellia lanceoleosa]
MVVVQHLLRNIENFIEEHPSKNELAPHKHPLSEFDGNEGGGGIKCDKCQQLISERPTCVCWPCKYFIHKSCKLELPLKIYCRFHNRHPLPTKIPLKEKLEDYSSASSEKELTSSACELPFMAHEHPLTVLHEQSTDSLYVCLNCSEKFSGPPVLYCVTCNDNFHIQCLLPSKIKSTCHVHPLDLVNSLEEDSGLDDEYYCDACETERIPKQPVYHCMEGCLYDAHVNCAYSKVENVIEHEGIKHDKNERSEEVVTLEDLFKSLTLEDSEAVKDIILAAKDFKLYHCRFSSEVVKTGNYLIPKKLAPVFQDLLDQYGDFSAESTMSLKVKNCIYIALCDVAYHMSNTRLKDYGHEVFYGQDRFSYAQNAGLKVQSAIDDFKKIVGAYCSLHARFLVEKLDQQIESLRARIESLVEKRAQLLTSPVMSREDEFSNEVSALNDEAGVSNEDNSIDEDDVSNEEDSYDKDGVLNAEYYCDACEKERIPNQPVYQCAEGCMYVAHVNCAFSKGVEALEAERAQHLVSPIMSLGEEFWNEAFALDGETVGASLLKI